MLDINNVKGKKLVELLKEHNIKKYVIESVNGEGQVMTCDFIPTRLRISLVNVPILKVTKNKVTIFNKEIEYEEKEFDYLEGIIENIRYG